MATNTNHKPKTIEEINYLKKEYEIEDEEANSTEVV